MSMTMEQKLKSYWRVCRAWYDHPEAKSMTTSDAMKSLTDILACTNPHSMLGIRVGDLLGDIICRSADPLEKAGPTHG